MRTQFLVLTLPLLPTPLENRQQVEAAIAAQTAQNPQISQEHGSCLPTCLRWAITQLDPKQQVMRVEAIVLTPD